MNSRIAIIIPAFKPSGALMSLVAALCERTDYPLYIVNDGSGAEYESLFRSIAALPRVTVCEHALNLGKGAALKTGFNQALLRLPEIDAIITADADGQHAMEDILTVAEVAGCHKGTLVLGVRRFGRQTPFRSWVGNHLSRWLYRLLLGVKVSDTQTGLRAIPTELIKRSLQIATNRYEFETEQLAVLSSMRMPITEVPIRTIYEDNNASSHFNPLVDSARIYFVVLRYALSSLTTSMFDFMAFGLLIAASVPVISANMVSRAVALMVQYGLLSTFVFKTQAGLWRFFAFVAYVMFTGFVSGLLQVRLAEATGLTAFPAKIIIESVIFVFNFLFLRDILFARRNNDTGH